MTPPSRFLARAVRAVAGPRGAEAARTWVAPVRRWPARLVAAYRRLALQSSARPGQPGGVGPLLVIGPYARLAVRPIGRMLESALRGTHFHLLDTSHMQNREIDVRRVAERAFGEGADPIVFFHAGQWLGKTGNRLVNHEGLRKLLEINDQRAQFRVILQPHGFHGFLYRYLGEETDRLLAMTMPLGMRGYYYPFYLDAEQHRDWGLPKSYDVCFYGTVHPKTYPLRTRLRALLAGGPRGLRVRIVSPAEGLRGARLSRVVNRSWLTVADTVGVHDRFVAKYVEIPLSASCILGNAPTRHRDLFAGRMVEVDPRMSDAEILDVVERSLADRDRLIRMTQALRAEMLARYTLDRGREAFWAILRDFAAARSGVETSG